MFDDYGSTNTTYHAHRAYEIELHVRELEKKNALMNLKYTSRHASGSNFFANMKRTARRLTSLVSALFVA